MPEPQADLQVQLDYEDLKRRSLFGGAATFAAQGVRFAFQFASQVLLAHLISPSAFGLVAMVAPLIGLVQLLNDLGLSQATIQRLKISQTELSGLFWLNVAGALVLSGVVIAAAPLASWFYGQPALTAIMAALAAPVLLAGVSAQHMALLNRRMQFVPLACIDIGATAAAAIVGILTAWIGWGYWALVAMQVTNGAAIMVLSWTLARWRPSLPRFHAGLPSLVKFGGSITVYNIFDYLSYNLDNVLVGVVCGSVPLGFYDRSYRLMIQPLAQILIPFTRIAVPLLSRLQDERDAYRKAYLQIMQALMLTVIPALVFAAILSRPLVLVLLGTRWEAASPFFAWLALGAIAGTISHPTYWVFVSQGRVREQLIWGCTASTLIMISFAVGLPWGPAGVAASSAGCYWLIAGPMLLIAALRAGPVRLADVIDGCYPILLGSLAAALALWAGGDWFRQAHVLGVAAGLGTSYLAHAVVLLVLPSGNRILRNAQMLRTLIRRAEA